MSDNFRRLKLSKCFPKLIFLRQNFVWGMYPEQSVTNSWPPFGDCDVNAAVRQLPLYNLAIDKRSYISTNSYSFYRYKNLTYIELLLSYILDSRILMTKQQWFDAFLIFWIFFYLKGLWVNRIGNGDNEQWKNENKRENYVLSYTMC